MWFEIMKHAATETPVHNDKGAILKSGPEKSELLRAGAPVYPYIRLPE